MKIKITKRLGRPPLGADKLVRVMIQVHAADLNKLKRTAKSAQKTFAEFARDKLTK